MQGLAKNLALVRFGLFGCAVDLAIEVVRLDDVEANAHDVLRWMRLDVYFIHSFDALRNRLAVPAGSAPSPRRS